MRGKRVSTGAPNSGTEVIANRMLQAGGLDPAKDIQAQRTELGKTVEGMKDGSIDAMFWSGGLPTSLRAGDPAQTEARLRQAVERNPESGPALFALGNLYARQGRWQDAQHHYFRAYTSVPSNADYAFNLAVGLDRLNQAPLALSYYQKALALAASGTVSFDRAAAQRRVRELGGQ